MNKVTVSNNVKRNSTIVENNAILADVISSLGIEPSDQEALDDFILNDI